MGEARDGLRLTQQARAGLGGSAPRLGLDVEELDGDAAIQLRIVGRVDFAHAAPAQQGDEQVTPDRGPVGQRVGDGPRPLKPERRRRQRTVGRRRGPPPRWRSPADRGRPRSRRCALRPRRRLRGRDVPRRRPARRRRSDSPRRSSESGPILWYVRGWRARYAVILLLARQGGAPKPGAGAGAVRRPSRALPRAAAGSGTGRGGSLHRGSLFWRAPASRGYPKPSKFSDARTAGSSARPSSGSRRSSAFQDEVEQTLSEELLVGRPDSPPSSAATQASARWPAGWPWSRSARR